MKKKRFMKLLALASCVTLLTGCESEAFFGLGKYANKIADWGVGLLEKLGLKEAEKKEEKGSEDKPSGEGEQGGEEGGQEGGGQEGGGQEGGGEGGEGGEGGGQEEIEVAITVKDFQPEFEVGDTIDLDEYVTLDVENVSFSVEVASASSELASVEGHVLSVLGAGDISFSIKAGKSEKECSIKAVEMHASRAFMIDYFKDFGHRYTAEITSYDSEQGVLVTDDVIYHNTNYVYQANAGKDDNGNPYGLGFLRFEETDEKAYLFTVELDDNQEEQVILDDKYGISYLTEYYNSDFHVDFSKIAYEYDAEYQEECYVLKDDEARYFARDVLFVANGLAYGVAPITRVEFSIFNFGTSAEPDYEVCAYPTFQYGGKTYYYGYCFLSNDPDDIGYPLVDAFCVPENRPVLKDYYNEFLSNDEYFDGTEVFYGKKLSDLLLAPEGVFGASGSISGLFGWIDPSTYEFLDEDLSSVETSWFGGTLPNGYYSYLTGENSIWEVEEVYENEQFDHYEPIQGVMSAEVGDPAEEKVFNAYYLGNDQYMCEEATGKQSAWDVLSSDPSDVTLSGLANASIWSDKTVSQCSVTKDDADNTSYRLSIDTTESEDLLKVLWGFAPNLNDRMATIDYVFETYYEENYLESLSAAMYFTPATGAVTFTVMFYMFQDAYYYFQVDMTPDSSVASVVEGFETAASSFIS